MKISETGGTDTAKCCHWACRPPVLYPCSCWLSRLLQWRNFLKSSFRKLSFECEVCCHTIELDKILFWGESACCRVTRILWLLSASSSLTKLKIGGCSRISDEGVFQDSRLWPIFLFSCFVFHSVVLCEPSVVRKTSLLASGCSDGAHADCRAGLFKRSFVSFSERNEESNKCTKLPERWWIHLLIVLCFFKSAYIKRVVLLFCQTNFGINGCTYYMRNVDAQSECQKWWEYDLSLRNDRCTNWSSKIENARTAYAPWWVQE